MLIAGKYDFGGALRELRSGKRMHRAGWNGKGMYIELQTPTITSKMTLPYIYMHTQDGEMVPWAPSQTDLLTMDWMEV